MTDVDPSFETLLGYLKEQRGLDLTGYKRASLMRRFRRRMDTVGVSTFDEYLDHLQVRQDEFTPLIDTILINVTGFFRDSESWAYLGETIVPEMLNRIGRGPVRVWSAGCASGAEAYSLAIVLAEAMGIDDYRRRVKIYATDVDEDALTTARHATYTERELNGLDPALLSTYFEPNGGRYVFRKELRRSVIFGRNDLVQDAPISHVDLLVCRNTLMYFNAETQSQMLNRLHFALNPDGVLFLGKAEMLLSHTELFTPIELKRRFFRRTESSRPKATRLLVSNGNGDPPSRNGDVDRVRDEALLSSPVAQVVVDTNGSLAFFNRRAEALFGLSPRDLNRPIQDLEFSYRPIELRGYLDQVTRERTPVWVRDVFWRRTPDEPITLDLEVVPLTGARAVPLGATVIFHDVTRYRRLQDELQQSNRALETAYEELQSTNEELETTNEELQSTVEELETTNEELQSTNEELETMNEELQSMNDELHASNDDLRDDTAEAGERQRFMTDVLASMHPGVMVIDGDLTVQAWNVAAEDLWGLRSFEVIGEPLLGLDIGLPLEPLAAAARGLMDGSAANHATMQVEAVNRRGRPVQLKVTVSRLTETADGMVGVVLVMDHESADPTSA